jgi:DNA-binding transcriptional LysR family regulator
MDWDKLRIFHAVADAGSLTHAGDTLHLSQSAVSRQIRALEESLNTTLFHRHARGLILTEQGELLFEATASWSSGWTPPPPASATARKRCSASCA